VLVLNPGTSASAAYFEPLAKDVVTRARGWQVWAVERRENLLEDQSVLDKAKGGKATGKQLFGYYLGWLADSSIRTHFQFIPDSSVQYAKPACPLRRSCSPTSRTSRAATSRW
jgi:hypothetical protein